MLLSGVAGDEGTPVTLAMIIACRSVKARLTSPDSNSDFLMPTQRLSFDRVSSRHEQPLRDIRLRPPG
jgi:hypothetical protein